MVRDIVTFQAGPAIAAVDAHLWGRPAIELNSFLEAVEPLELLTSCWGFAMNAAAAVPEWMLPHHSGEHVGVRLVRSVRATGLPHVDAEFRRREHQTAEVAFDDLGRHVSSHLAAVVAGEQLTDVVMVAPSLDGRDRIPTLYGSVAFCAHLVRVEAVVRREHFTATVSRYRAQLLGQIS